MKHLTSIALAAAALLYATVLPAQSAPPGGAQISFDSVTVTGTGRLSTPPDRVSFTAGVETTAPTVDDAVRTNNERMAALIAALKKGGAADKDLRTSNFMVYPQQVYEQNQKPRVVGFQVNNSVTVTKQNPAEAGKLLTSAVNAGANQVSGLTFSIADPVPSRNRALQLAFEDARNMATLLATAAGRSLGRAVVINQGSAQPRPPVPMFQRSMAMEAKTADVPVESGTEELSYDVTVVFELK